MTLMQQSYLGVRNQAKYACSSFTKAFFSPSRLCFPYEYKIMLMWQGGTMAVIECVSVRVFLSLPRQSNTPSKSGGLDSNSSQ